DEAVQVLPEVMALDRHAVRRRFDERFSATRMAKDYVQLYRSLLKRSSLQEPAVAARDARPGRTTGSYPGLQPELEKEMNCQGLHADRARGAPEIVTGNGAGHDFRSAVLHSGDRPGDTAAPYAQARRHVRRA